MKKIKTSFMVAKQNVMEKTHNRENTQETKVLKDFERRVDDQTFYLRKICKNIKKETTSSAASVTDGNALADTFIDYGVKMRDQNDLEILTGVLSKVGEFQVGLEDLRAKLNLTLINDVCSPLHAMVKSELKTAKDSKGKYDRYRIQYDAAIADLASVKRNKYVKPSKVQEAEEECEKQRALFDGVENETLVLMQETSEFETVEKLCDYLEAYHKFFQKGFRWLNQMLPDIYEYRQYVEKRKSDLENTKVRASMIASQQTAAPSMPVNRIFGEDLMTLVKRDNAVVPKFITEAFNHIREKALDEEGIFRVSGNKREVMEYRAKIEQGGTSGVFADIVDHSIVASLVKMFLRELPDPLLTYDRYKQFLATVEIDNQDQRVAELAKLVATLPTANHELLRQLFELCTDIAAHVKTTKMGAANLATVLAPNVLVSNSEDVRVDDVAIGNIVITTMIQNFDKIFPPEDAAKTFDWVTDIHKSTSKDKPLTSGKDTVRRHRPTHPTPSTPTRTTSSHSVSAPSDHERPERPERPERRMTLSHSVSAPSDPDRPPPDRPPPPVPQSPTHHPPAPTYPLPVSPPRTMSKNNITEKKVSFPDDVGNEDLT